MWLFTKDSFVSIVQHRTQPNTVLVRARRKIDIERLFPDKAKHIRVDGLADYPYRLFVSKHELNQILKNYIENDLTYPNFKSAQNKNSPSVWKNFLYEVWELGLHYLQQPLNSFGGQKVQSNPNVNKKTYEMNKRY